MTAPRAAQPVYPGRNAQRRQNGRRHGAGLREQIALLVRDGVSAEELARVKAQVTANEVYNATRCFIRPCKSASWKA